MNYHGIIAIYTFEMSRTLRTIGQSIASPVISTVLYFVVFGTALGSRISDINGVSFGSFIVPGLIMMTILSQSIANASFGIFFPRFSNTIYEILSAPLSYLEICLSYVGAAASKAMIIGIIVLLTAGFFVPIEIKHPFLMAFFLIITCITFSLLGFIVGIWADNFEKLQILPMLVIGPLTFLGGAFYSIDMLPNFWRIISLANPVVYLISGFRWSFYESSDINIFVCLGMIFVFLVLFLIIISWIFKTGYKLKN